MPTVMVTENEFKAVARAAGGEYAYNARGFVLISYGRARHHHIRIDLKKFEGGGFRKLGDRNAYMHLVSSFHIKEESRFSEASRTMIICIRLRGRRCLAAGMGLRQD
jgi:hypothetical protein